jgi:hypothetical protein
LTEEQISHLDTFGQKCRSCRRKKLPIPKPKNIPLEHLLLLKAHLEKQSQQLSQYQQWKDILSNKVECGKGYGTIHKSVIFSFLGLTWNRNGSVVGFGRGSLIDEIMIELGASVPYKRGYYSNCSLRDAG